MPNAGAISWLLTNIGPTVTTLDQEAALQAAIWRTEYGPSGFQVNSVDNSDTTDTTGEEAIMQPFYKSYLQALGNNTAPVSSVDWISPDEVAMDQGLVALPTTSVAPLTLGGLSPTQWEVDEPDYDGTIAISGGTGSYTNLNVTGLPTGLSASLESSTVNVNGVPMLSGTIFISGTPTESGTFTLGVTVDDGTEPVIGIAVSPIRSAGVTTDNSNNSTGETSAKLTIIAAPTLGALSPLTTVNVNGLWQTQFTMPVSGGTAPYALSSITGMPKGLNATLPKGSSTITITGKPTKIGPFNCVVHLTDNKGVKPSNPSFVLTITTATLGQIDGVPRGNEAEDSLADNMPLATALAKAATNTVTDAELRTIISIESTANPNYGVTGAYAGPFQVSKAAASDAGYKNLTLPQLAEWQTNVTVAAKYLQKWCAKQLVSMKFPVTALNLYLCYQQGQGGCKTLLTEVQNGTAGKKPATSDERGNPRDLKTYLPPNRQLTVQDYYNYWAAKFAAVNAIVNNTN